MAGFARCIAHPLSMTGLTCAWGLRAVHEPLLYQRQLGSIDLT